MIKKWYGKDYINKKEMLQRVSNSILLKTYRLLKTHKKNIPLRIIVSSVNTTLYSLAKFLNKIISDNIPRSESQVKNSFELYHILSNKIIPDSRILCSFVSLFTNIPLDLAINSIAKRWEYLERFTKITKSEFLAAINFIFSSTYFKFIYYILS